MEALRLAGQARGLALGTRCVICSGPRQTQARGGLVGLPSMQLTLTNLEEVYAYGAKAMKPNKPA